MLKDINQIYQELVALEKACDNSSEISFVEESLKYRDNVEGDERKFAYYILNAACKLDCDVSDTRVIPYINELKEQNRLDELAPRKNKP